MHAILYYRVYDKTELFRLTLVLDRSFKTKDITCKIRPNACRHFKMLCKLVLTPELVLRSILIYFVKSPIVLSHVMQRHITKQ